MFSGFEQAFWDGDGAIGSGVVYQSSTAFVGVNQKKDGDQALSFFFPELGKSVTGKTPGLCQEVPLSSLGKNS